MPEDEREFKCPKCGLLRYETSFFKLSITFYTEDNFSIDKRSICNQCKITELEQKLEKQEMEIIKLGTCTEDYNDGYEDAIKTFKDRVKALEKHDIFRIWDSVRGGGKTTLDALIKNTQGIRHIEKEIADIKNELNQLKKLIPMSWKQDNNEIKILLLEGVLREHYKQRIEKSDWTIKALQSSEEEKEKTMVEYVKDDLEFYKKQLERLSGEQSVGKENVGHAVKKNIPLTDSKLVESNEYLNPHLQCNGECYECDDDIPPHGIAPNQCARQQRKEKEPTDTSSASHTVEVERAHLETWLNIMRMSSDRILYPTRIMEEIKKCLEGQK